MNKFKKRILAFKVAFRGIGLLFFEIHFKLHLIALALVSGAGFYFNITKLEWIAILLISSLVLSLEAINSSIERLANTLHPSHHEGIKNTKDIAAGSVLISSIIAVVIAVVIFTPYLIA